jgi:hypothetical protein
MAMQPMNPNQPIYERRKVKYTEGKPLLEWIKQPLYDRAATTTATTTQLTFFSSPLSATKTKVDTNMVMAGSLPKPRVIDIYGIFVQCAPGTTLADLRKFYNNAYFSLDIGSKNYLEVPMLGMPSGLGLIGTAVRDTSGTPTTVDEFTNGVPHLSNIFNVSLKGLPLHIPSLQNFSCTIYINPTQTFSAAFNVTVYLWGVTGREVM